MSEPLLDFTVIVAEDEPLIRQIAVEFLSDAGLDVIEGADAKTVLDLLQSHQDGIHLLFTDIQMPGKMNGLELARYVNSNRPEIKLLIVSGDRRPQKHELPHGSRFVPKPYSHGEIINHIRLLMTA